MSVTERYTWIDRWNDNTLRRYHLPRGNIVVVRHDRSCVVIPAFCHHISAPINRRDAANLILTGRSIAHGL